MDKNVIRQVVLVLAQLQVLSQLYWPRACLQPWANTADLGPVTRPIRNRLINNISNGHARCKGQWVNDLSI